VSKKEIDTKVLENGVADTTFNGKTIEELEEIAKTLESQAMQYQTMSIKAQGALEVVLQMLPEKKGS